MATENQKSSPRGIRAKQRAAAVERDPRWAMVRARDARADGKFFYSVATTGVYCRPSCAARLARSENVQFHATSAEAVRAGFRACKRCRPDQPPIADRRATLVAGLCRVIEASEEAPVLEELARHAGLSAFHVHRLFKSVTGVTPKVYAAAHRAGRLRQELHTSRTVTEAIFAAGYRSSSRFYEKSAELLGMKPTAYRTGGTDLAIRFAVAKCSLGSLLVAATDRGVCAIFLGDDPHNLVRELQQRFGRAQLVGGDRAFEELVAQVVELVEQPKIGTTLPLDIHGTAFQQRVWDALRRIPPGMTASYSEIADAVGAPRAARAVARACAANTLAVAIPCHRVVRGDGEPGGYRWGVSRKRVLLARESES